MRCKQGDLAVVVRSAAGNDGKIVRCLELLPDHGWLRQDGAVTWEPSWRIDIPLRGFLGDVSYTIADRQLRPIRDPGDDARDETLDWLPVPSKELERA